MAKAHKRLQGFLMICGFIAAAANLGAAQDYEAVGKRLKDAVKSGEISEKQAHAMMAALKKTAVNYEAVTKRLKDSVDKGEITAKQAEAMLAALKKSGAEKGKHPVKKGKHVDSEMAAVKNKIWGAVKAGDLTEKEAEKKWKEYLKSRRKGESKSGKKGDDLEAIWKELQAAVKAGKLTKEEAAAKMAELKKKRSKEKE